MIKIFKVNIWLVEKRHSYPRAKFYEADTKQEVTTMVKKDFPNYKELLFTSIKLSSGEAHHLKGEK